MKNKAFNVRSIKYYISEAFRSLIRNSLMSLSSIATVASCIFIVVFSFCIASNIDFILEQVEETVGLSVFLDNSLSEEQVKDLRNTISEIEHIARVEYVSSEDALSSFADWLGDSKDIVKDLENDNPLPRSFTITLDNLKNQNEVIEALESTKIRSMGVSKVRHAKETMSVLTAINNAVRIISLFIILILGVLSVVIITNTIKLTVNSRRNEITIMKYVGATDWFIKWPFVIEGILIGIIGASLPVFIFWAGYGSIIDAILSRYAILGTLEFQFKTGIEIFPFLIPVGVFLGSLIGILGSVTSMRKHLNV